MPPVRPRPARALAALSGALALLLTACAAPARHTPYSAGVLAAEIANDRCQERYGARPFRAEDFAAEWRDGRWSWGGEDARPVDGFSATVTFGADGGARQVDVNRHEHRGNPQGW